MKISVFILMQRQQDDDRLNKVSKEAIKLQSLVVEMEKLKKNALQAEDPTYQEMKKKQL